MRLMCPNCDAEYEVDASAIPESGRDVQCSNCGHAWFQHHPDQEADEEAEAALYDPPPPLSKTGMSGSILPSDLDWQVESDDPEAILDAMGRDAREQGANRPPSSRADPDESGRPEDVPKHDLDPEALRILREEAEFETAQRAREQALAAESTEFPAPPVAARRVARLKGIQPTVPNPPADRVNDATPAQTTSASARLPKIETVSAALRHDEVLPEDPKPQTGRGGGVTVFILALAATSAYIFSPNLSTLAPSLAKPLADYVGFVDGLRDQLDQWVPQGIAWIESGIALVKGWF